MADSKRGGARVGAGRPKGEGNTMVRVPDGCLEAVRALISAYRNHEPLPETAPVLPAPAPNAMRSDFDRAWAIYESMFARRPGWELLRERFFWLPTHLELPYPFLFLTHLLERLLDLSVDDSIPVQWANIRELRQFASDLYVHNGHLK